MPDTGVLTVVGSANIDTTLRVSRIPTAGETILSRERRVSPGGKGANQATAAAAAGHLVRFIGATGSGEDAVLALTNLRAVGVDVSGVQEIEGEATGAAVIVVAEDAENLIVVDPGANGHLHAAHVREHLMASRTDVVLTQLETPVDVAQVCASFHDATWRILNPAPMTAALSPRELLNGFNVVIPNRTELSQLVGRPEPTSLSMVVEYVRELAFPGVVVVTMGVDGAALFPPDADRPTVFAPPPVRPVDTSGAGDVFCGVFAGEMALNGDLHRAVEEAVRMSALSTERHGAQLIWGQEPVV